MTPGRVQRSVALSYFNSELFNSEMNYSKAETLFAQVFMCSCVKSTLKFHR